MGVGVSFNYIKELLELTWFYIFGFIEWEGYNVETSRNYNCDKVEINHLGRKGGGGETAYK